MLNTLAVLIALSTCSAAPDATSQRKQTVKRVMGDTVSVEALDSHGTGVTVRRGGELFVLTAWHVVAGNRQEVAEKPPVFRDVLVSQYRLKDGKLCEKKVCSAEIVAFSDQDGGFDLALLRVRDARFSEWDTAFTEDVWVGEPVYHVGCFYGGQGVMSFSDGTLSQMGRMIKDRVYDQVTTTNFPGSSGGGVFDADGRCVGLIDRRLGETFGYIIPVREIRLWAEKNGMSWVLKRGSKPGDMKDMIKARDATPGPPQRPPAVKEKDKGQQDLQDLLFDELLRLIRQPDR